MKIFFFMLNIFFENIIPEDWIEDNRGSSEQRDFFFEIINFSIKVGLVSRK